MFSDWFVEFTIIRDSDGGRILCTVPISHVMNPSFVVLIGIKQLQELMPEMSSGDIIGVSAIRQENYEGRCDVCNALKV